MNRQSAFAQQIWPDCDLNAFIRARTNSGMGEVSVGFRDLPHELVCIFHNNSHASGLMMYCCDQGTFVHPNSRICSKCYSPFDIPEEWPRSDTDIILLERLLSRVLDPLASALVANIVSERLMLLNTLESTELREQVPAWLESLNSELTVTFRDRL